MYTKNLRNQQQWMQGIKLQRNPHLKYHINENVEKFDRNTVTGGL
jgi:hypothetical protein